MPLKTELTVSREEAECILNCLTGNLLKSEANLRATIRGQIESRLHPKVNPKSNGWAPMGRIKPSWPSNFTFPTRRSGSRKPRDKKPKTEKPTMSPQEILAELSL